MCTRESGNENNEIFINHKGVSDMMYWKATNKYLPKYLNFPVVTRPGADCGSDHECLIAKFRLKLNKLGKTTRPFRYDLNIQWKWEIDLRD